MSVKTILPILIGLGACIASPAFAQNSEVSQLYEQVLQNNEFAKAGYIMDTFGMVRIQDGKKSRHQIGVPPNTNVQIMGDCDSDCRDLDLVAYNSQGKKLAEDIADDYYPIIVAKSDDSGIVDIEFTMVDCDAVYCYASYTVFVQDTQ